MSSDNLLNILKARGFIDQTSSAELEAFLEKPRRVYVGFDPTAPSLHIGNLVGICALRWFQIHGHTPVVILGGATAKIGDPSGKSIERPLLSKEEIAHNISALQKIFAPILDPEGKYPKPIFFNNEQWLGRFTLLDFMRDVGKFFRIGPMLSKDSVKTRLNSPEGISFTEFTYQALQGYDFYHLFEQEDISIQMGGSDQWGNITAGIELTRKILGKAVFGITYPLLTKSDGTKFGKTEEGAVWLSKELLSPYKFYQYFVRLSDHDVIQLMRMLTFISIEEIQDYEKNLGHDPQAAQKRLAEEVTRLVHGDLELASAQKATEVATPGKKIALSADGLKALADQIPTKRLVSANFLDQTLIDVLIASGLAESKGALRRLIQNGGLYLNENRIEDPSYILSKKDLLDRHAIVALGKKNKALLVVE